MTGPDEPWVDPPAWDFPELSSPDPGSVALPDPEPEPIYDTGSDGWWRAQARAQREAAGNDPEPPPLFRPMPPIEMPPPELIEPTVLNDPAYLPSGPSVLDEAYLPPEEVFPAVAEQAWEPAYEQTYEEVASPPLMRPLVVPEPTVDEDDWYDAPPPVPVESGGGNGVGFVRALAWAGLALAGVGLLVVAFLLLGKDEPKGSPTVSAPVATNGPTQTASPTPTPTPEPTPTPSVSAVPAATPAAPVVPLTVLNNSRITGLAERSAAKFRAGGWPVPTTGNYRGQIDETTIYYPPGQQASAERFARQFGVRVLPRFATLPGKGMTVVVTRDQA